MRLVKITHSYFLQLLLQLATKIKNETKNSSFAVFIITIFFSLLLFFVPNNKILLVLITIYTSVLYIISGDIEMTLFLSTLFSLPFTKGKSFTFPIVPADKTPWGLEYLYSPNISIADGLILLLCLVHIRSLFFKKRASVRPEIHHIALLLFLGFTIISLLFSNIFTLSSLLTARLCGAVLLYALTKIVINNKVALKLIPGVLSAILLFQGIWSILQIFVNGPLSKAIESRGAVLAANGYNFLTNEESFFRLRGTFDHPNTLASFVVTFSPFLVFEFLFSNNSPFHKKWIFISLLLGAAGLIGTASRVSWVVFFGLLICILWYSWKAKRSIFHQYRGYMRVVLILILCSLPILITRLASFSKAIQSGGGLEFRSKLLEKAIAISLNNPFGVGLGMFLSTLYIEAGGFEGSPAQPHNLFAEIAASAGFPALAMFVIFISFEFIKFYKTTRLHKTSYLHWGAFFSSVGFLLVAMAYPFFLELNIFAYFWIFLALMSSAKAR